MRADRRSARPRDKVAEVIEEAVRLPPARRYVVGLDARIQIGLRSLLPARVDALLARMMGVR